MPSRVSETANASPMRGRMGAIMITWLLEENTISQSAIRIRYVLGVCLDTDRDATSAKKEFQAGS